jgi:hypothetical protein
MYCGLAGFGIEERIYRVEEPSSLGGYMG